MRVERLGSPSAGLWLKCPWTRSYLRYKTGRKGETILYRLGIICVQTMAGAVAVNRISPKELESGEKEIQNPGELSSVCGRWRNPQKWRSRWTEGAGVRGKRLSPKQMMPGGPEG